MSNIRANRVAEQIKTEIGEILTLKIKEPIIGFVTITDVDVTGDLQQATIYFSVLGEEEEEEETLAGLETASGFIRSEIGQRIRLRKTPEITFEFDEAHEYGNHIETLLRDLKQDYGCKKPDLCHHHTDQVFILINE